MKTLYLHIGTPKTATTSLQAFLVHNQKELNRHGFCYPAMPFKHNADDACRNAHFTFGYIYDKQRNRCHELEEQYRNEDYAILTKTFETYDNVILSDEGLWHCGFREDCNAWERLRQEMQTHNFRIKVILYLRRQDEFLYSWWAQNIKTQRAFKGNTSWNDTLQHLSTLPLIKLNYYEMLERISEYVGKENIIVRRFGKQYFKDHSIYSDFLHLIGLEYTNAYEIQDDILNLSLTPNYTEIKRYMNQIPDLSKQERAFFSNIIAENSAKKGKDTKYTMYTKEEAQSIYEEYRESNHKVAKEYLGIDEDLFDFEYTPKERWTPSNEEMLENMFSFMTESILKTRREMDKLNRELISTKKELEAQKKQSNYILNILQHPVQAIGRKLKKKS